MVSLNDVYKIFLKNVKEGNNNLGKEISLGRYFFTWKYIKQDDKDFSLVARTRFQFLDAVFDLLVELEVGVFGDLSRRMNMLKHVLDKEEITADEQSLVEEILQEFLEAWENSLLPEVHKIFITTQEENLLCFPRGAHEDIFLKIMEQEEDGDQMYKVSDDDDHIRYATLRKDLSFIHTNIQGCDFIECQQFRILLEEFDTIAFEILSLIYSCLFEKLTSNLFDKKRCAMLQNISLFTEKYFTMVSAYDIREEAFSRASERNGGKGILLARPYLTTLGFEVYGFDEISPTDKIRCRVLEYALDMDPWSEMNENDWRWKKWLWGRDEIKKYEKSLLEEVGQESLSMLPKVHQLFTSPNMHLYESSQDGLSPTEPNCEALLRFINFLLDILSCAESSDDKQIVKEWSDYNEKLDDDDEDDDDEKIIGYSVVLHNELTLLFTILGEIPFQFTNHDILLPQFETIAIEIGSLIYDCLFEKLTSTMFDERRDAMLEHLSLLKSFIEKHFHEFSDLCPRYLAPSTVPIDAPFVVDSLVHDLENLNNYQFDCNVDVVKLVQILRDEINISMALLKEIYKLPQHRDKDELLTESLIQIRDIAYETEYLINSHVTKQSHVWYLNLRLPSIILKIEITNKTLQDISCDENINNSSNEAMSQPLLALVAAVDNLVVGFEENKIRILGDIIGGPKNLNTICIVGMPGLGKTTTSRKLYEDQSVYHHFDRRGWCVVSQEYEKRKVLIEIFTSLGNKLSNNDIMKLKYEKIGLKIHQNLFRRRYLIVIDDVWKSRVLDDLGQYFPDDANGSRILLTSRNQNVAPIGSIVCPLHLLSDAQSWELLRNQVFLNEPCPPELLELGKQIAANCRGLPLALVTTAGILRNVKKEESAWDKMNKQLDTHLLDNFNSYRKILERSFEHLPNHLKLCFLYVGIFPEDTEIQTGRLIRMWIAERFIQKKQEKEPEDVGKEYLGDLISRSLLVIAKRGSDGEIKTCTIHDLLRDMCIRRAHDENFIKYIGRDEFPISGKHNCLVSDCQSPKWRYLPPYCRTYTGHVSRTSGFSRMPLLRVMDNRDQSSVPDYFIIPNQLRYLAFGRMPESEEGNFTNLEFLHVRWESFGIMPSIILKIVKLRYLRVDRYAQFEAGCENSTESSLRYLSKVYIKKDEDMEILKCSPHLRRLKCRLPETRLDLDFSFFSELESLTVSCSRFASFSEIRFPPDIKKLHLDHTGLPWEKMSIIGALPKLIVLKLSEDAFSGEVWNTAEGEFLELRFLKLDNIQQLKRLNSCNEHFPKLESLALERCFYLLAIPADFGTHATLQKIELFGCNEEMKAYAYSIEEQQRGYGNEHFQVIIRGRYYK